MPQQKVQFLSMVIIVMLFFLFVPTVLAGTNLLFLDNNKNGIDDYWEKKYGLDLTNKLTASEDPDKDGLTNLVEYKLNLNPKSSDTDKNGVPDGFEDYDNDGLYNLAEVKLGFNPKVPDIDKTKIINVVDMADKNMAKNESSMTDQLHNALKLGAGKVIVLPSGSSFKISGLVVPDNTTIVGYGSKLYNDKKHQTLLTIGNGVKIYGIELQGAGNKKADAKGVGIKIRGTDAANYVQNIVIEDCIIHDVGFYGIMAEFADAVTISNTVIRDVGFAGVGGLSVRNMHINKSHIKSIKPGNKGNAYGVFYSRKGAESNVKAHPRSTNSSVTNSIIEDIPLWEALDTHGGENITFNNNTIRNTKVGIAFVNATGKGGKELFGSQKCTAKGNRIEGIGKGYGIVVAGTPSENSRGCTIEGNHLIEAGQQGNSISGAIQASYTRDLVIKNNTLVNSYANGIHLYTYNQQFTVTGNRVEDVQDSSYKVPSAIAFRSGNNSGTITGNSLIKKNAKLNRYVSIRGINITTKTNMKLVLGKNTNNYVLPIAGGTGSHVKYILK
ncbi:right-handed parallel beta-helix repeat-containing protein [Neobacillus sp. YIM B06451]|uniref:right-handed parallel beta-helix repeat-containing protein n=1 Tax=Neobacillus sp. YIM B06451 TaxID=3070994 RepID=UPI00292CA5E1|nr:right-handed parallel beta-helix repeat-containing protein [Neobacillus sp. YIM B06451]